VNAVIPRLCLVLPLAALGAHAFDAGAFVGVWKLNVQASRTSEGKPLTLNRSHMISILQQGDAIVWSEQRIAADGKTFSNFASIGSPGEEAPLVEFLDGASNRDSRIALTVKGASLEQRFRGSHGPGKEFRGLRRLRISADGKSLTAEFEANRYGVNVSWTEVWDRF